MLKELNQEQFLSDIQVLRVKHNTNICFALTGPGLDVGFAFALKKNHTRN